MSNQNPHLIDASKTLSEMIELALFGFIVSTYAEIMLYQKWNHFLNYSMGDKQ